MRLRLRGRRRVYTREIEFQAYVWRQCNIPLHKKASSSDMHAHLGGLPTSKERGDRFCGGR